MAHLATGGPAPVEWMEYELCTRFHWTLAEVRAMPLGDRLRLRTMMLAEAKVNQAKR